MFNILLIVMFGFILYQINGVQKEQENHSKRLDRIEEKLYIKRRKFEEFKSYIEDSYPRIDDKPLEVKCKSNVITQRDYEIDKQLNNIDFRSVIGKLKVEEVLEQVNNLSFPS